MNKAFFGVLLLLLTTSVWSNDSENIESVGMGVVNDNIVIFPDGRARVEYDLDHFEEGDNHGVSVTIDTNLVSNCTNGYHWELCRDIEDRNGPNNNLRWIPVEITVRANLIPEGNAPVDLVNLRAGVLNHLVVSADNGYTRGDSRYVGEGQFISYIRRLVEVSNISNEDMVFQGLEIFDYEAGGYSSRDRRNRVEFVGTFRARLAFGSVNNFNPARVAREYENDGSMLFSTEATAGIRFHRRVVIKLLGGLTSLRNFSRDNHYQDYFVGTELSALLFHNRNLRSTVQYRRTFITDGNPRGATTVDSVNGGVSIHW